MSRRIVLTSFGGVNAMTGGKQKFPTADFTHQRQISPKFLFKKFSPLLRGFDSAFRFYRWNGKSQPTRVRDNGFFNVQE